MTKKKQTPKVLAVRDNDEADAPVVRDLTPELGSWYPLHGTPTRAQKIEHGARTLLASLTSKQKEKIPFARGLQALLDLPADDVFADEIPPPSPAGLYPTGMELEYPPTNSSRVIRTIHMPDALIVKPGRPLVVKVSAKARGVR